MADVTDPDEIKDLARRLTSSVLSVGVDFVVTKIDVKPSKIIISLELSSKTTHFEVAWKVSANPATVQVLWLPTRCMTG